MTHDATVMMPTDRSTRPRHAHVSSADARDTWAAWHDLSRYIPYGELVAAERFSEIEAIGWQR